MEQTMFGVLLWLLGIGIDAVFSLLRAIVMLPARVLGLSPGG